MLLAVITQSKLSTTLIQPSGAFLEMKLNVLTMQKQKYNALNHNQPDAECQIPTKTQPESGLARTDLHLNS